MLRTVCRVVASFAAASLASCQLGCGRHEGPGVIEGARIAKSVIEARAAAQDAAATSIARRARVGGTPKQVLFGDLHVHTTISADAFLFSLPIMQGEGAHPVADACDFARYCSALDFWAITDHAESVTPRRWRETKETMRQCNALAGDPDDPDVVGFLGWEWTQMGLEPDDHYGHKNVVFRDLEDDEVPRRVIHSASYAQRAMRQPPPLVQRLLVPFLDWPNRQRYWNSTTFQAELREVPDCDEGIDTRELPEDCLEGAATPEALFEKLAQWNFDSLVIPHGTTWGIYTPRGSTWDKQLAGRQHDPERQTLIEVYSGHGNSEEYRDWRAVDLGADGTSGCPEPRDGYEPCCWRAGEIIRSRCEEPASEQCERSVSDARAVFLAAGPRAGRLTIPGATLEEWGDCETCRDCFNPAMNYRPASSVQYILALTNFDDPANPRRFHLGMIASSDNHRARPGTGYKEVARLAMTDANGPRDRSWFERLNATEVREATPEAVPYDPASNDFLPYQVMDFERQASFFMTGGLVAVHSAGRSRDAIWDALERREVYGTSGDRILLWFELTNGPRGAQTMGARTWVAETPRFRVRAVGAQEQLPGCPEISVASQSAERLRRLCHDECYNPGDNRRRITRIEVVRIRPQQRAGEPVAGLIEDPWKVIDCPDDEDGCIAEFDDPGLIDGGREAVYYVRAIQEPTAAINASGQRCVEYDAEGFCRQIEPCYGDYRTAADDDCLAKNEERAWSSPIYVRPRASRQAGVDASSNGGQVIAALAPGASAVRPISASTGDTSDDTEPGHTESIAMPAAAPAQRADTRSVFFIERNKNRNEVHYGIHVDEECAPKGEEPLYNYWLRLEDGPDVKEPVKIFQQPAYGFKSQQVEGNRIAVVLRALPDRPLTVETRRDGATCAAVASIEIGGARRRFEKAFVYAEEGWLLPDVKYIDLFGTDDAGEPVTERLEMD